MKSFRIACLCLYCLLLAACGGKVVTRQPITTLVLTDTISPQPTATVTLTLLPTRTPPPTPTTSLTSTPQPTITRISVTFYPTRTATHTFTPATPTITSTPPLPFPTFQLTPATPAAGPEGYRLKPWTEQDARAAILEAKWIDANYSYPNEDLWPYAPYASWDYQDYLIELEREALLRPLSDTYRDTIQWDLLSGVLSLNYHSNMNPLEGEEFAALLQGALNSGQVSPEDLGTWLSHRGFDVLTSQPVKNLAGDGKTGWVFRVQFQLEYNIWSLEAVFALLGESPGEYRVEEVHHWQSLHWADIQVEVGDHNGNGCPEIVMMTYSWSSGFLSMYQFYSIDLYEWQPSTQHFINLAENLPLLTLDQLTGLGFDTNEKYPWHFGPADAYGVQTITAPLKYRLGKNCPDPAYTITYTWDGTQYHWASEEFNPLDVTAMPITCQVSWALLGYVQDEQSLEILEAALADASANFDATYGPAARDYLRLRLGMLYALRGQRHAAVQTLQSVRDQPEHPEFNMASQLAGGFLESYTAKGPVMACIQTVSFLDKALYGQIPQGNFLDYDHDFIVEKWGIDDPDWVHDGSAICDVQAAFKLALLRRNPQSLEQFVLWLNQTGITHEIVQTADLTGDGTQDWIVVLHMSSRNEWPVYIIVRDGGRLDVEVLEGFSYYDNITTDPIGVTLASLRPDPALAPVAILTRGDDLIAFRLVLAEPYSVEELIRDYNLAYVQVEPASQEIAVFYRGDETMKKVVFSWSPELHIFIDTTTEWLGAPPQDESIGRIESTLFSDVQPVDAIPALQTMLAGTIRESKYWEEEISPARIRPYLQYLLGLAYELTGDEANAVRSYWHVWHDYPTNPYALIARHKLEPVGR